MNPVPNPNPGRAEDGDHLRSLAHRHSAGGGFMCAQDVRQSVVLHELLHRLLSVAHGSGPSFAGAEAVLIEVGLLLVLRRVRPEEVQHHLPQLRLLAGTAERQVEGRGDAIDHIDTRRGRTVDGTGDASVNTKNHVVDRGGERQVVKHSVCLFPNLKLTPIFGSTEIATSSE